MGSVGWELEGVFGSFHKRDILAWSTVIFSHYIAGFLPPFARVFKKERKAKKRNREEKEDEKKKSSSSLELFLEG